MPAPTQIQWSLASRVGAQSVVQSLVDGGTGVGSIKVYDSSDALLMTLTLQSPGSFLEPSTGVLTLLFSSEYYYPSVNGVAAYGDLCDGDDVVVCSMPVAQSNVVVPNRLTFESLMLFTGIAVRMNPVTIG